MQRACIDSRSKGIDDLLAKHISHLFIRDPLVIFSELIDQDDASSSDHFEVRKFLMKVERRLTDNTEPSIHQLANHAVQAATSGF